VQPIVVALIGARDRLRRDRALALKSGVALDCATKPSARLHASSPGRFVNASASLALFVGSPVTFAYCVYAAIASGECGNPKRGGAGPKHTDGSTSSLATSSSVAFGTLPNACRITSSRTSAPSRQCSWT